jgi:ankyrin repeat protein
MGSRVKKPCKREDHRRKASFRISNGLTRRIILNSDEVLPLFRAISSNCLAQFGIVRLSNVDLNVQYPSLCLEGATTTLLDAACEAGSEQIVSALIRAGASPHDEK